MAWWNFHLMRELTWKISSYADIPFHLMVATAAYVLEMHRQIISPYTSTHKPSPTPRDASLHQSAAASAGWWGDPASISSARCAQTAAAPASRPTARRCRARCRCLRSSRSAANGSGFLEPGRDFPWPARRTCGKDLGQRCQTFHCPEARSAADRTDGPASAPILSLRS